MNMHDGFKQVQVAYLAVISYLVHLSCTVYTEIMLQRMPGDC